VALPVMIAYGSELYWPDNRCPRCKRPSEEHHVRLCVCVTVQIVKAGFTPHHIVRCPYTERSPWR
jgi:hypothetical protein